MINDSTEHGLIQHHVKYKELHGVDEIVLMTQSEHKKLHMRLRKNNKCQVPRDELHKISAAAHRRTDKYKQCAKKYRKTEQSIEYQKEYNRSENGRKVFKKSKTKYRKSEHGFEVEKIYRKNYQTKHSSKSFGKNTSFQEQIIHNNVTGNITYSGRFRGKHGFKLPVIDI